jgi:MFS family permease
LVLVLVGLAGLAAVLSAATPLWDAPLAWSIAGFGIGLAYSPISLTVLGWAATGQEGRASAAVQLTDVLGTSLGTGAAGAAVALFHHHAGGSRLGLGVAFALAGAVGLLAVALSPRLPARTGPASA